MPRLTRSLSAGAHPPSSPALEGGTSRFQGAVGAEVWKGGVLREWGTHRGELEGLRGPGGTRSLLRRRLTLRDASQRGRAGARRIYWQGKCLTASARGNADLDSGCFPRFPRPHQSPPLLIRHPFSGTHTPISRTKHDSISQASSTGPLIQPTAGTRPVLKNVLSSKQRG